MVALLANFYESVVYCLRKGSQINGVQVLDEKKAEQDEAIRPGTRPSAARAGGEH